MSAAEAPAPAAAAEAEALVLRSRIAVPYSWSAGLAGTRFLRALREERIFLASRCPSCRKLQVPPLKHCGACLEPSPGLVEVGPRGRLVSFTQARYASPAHPVPWPVYGLVRLDGADCALLVLMRCRDLSELRRGMRVEPVFRETRSDLLHEIVRFRAAAEAAG